MRKTDFLIGALLSLSLLTAYSYMLCPTVYWEDSGELIAAAHGLGIAHPPGHPLWVLLGRVFSVLPLGSPAHRVNLLSALSSSLTGSICFLTLLVLLRSVPFGQATSRGRPRLHGITQVSALTAALSLSFSKTFWFYSEIAEVYALLGFFCSVLLFRIFLFRATRTASLLIAFAYLCGLALTNNVIVLACLPAFVYAVIAFHRLEPSKYEATGPSDRLRIPPSNYFTLVLVLLLGLSCYLYLPIRSRFDPFVDWGNPESLANFRAAVFAKEFRGQFFSLSLTAAGGPLEGASQYFLGLPREFAFLGFALGVLGAVSLLLRERKMLLFILLGILLTVAFAVFAGGGPDQPAYFLPSYLFFSVLVGVGTFELLSLLRMRALFALLPLSVVLLATSTHLERNNQRGEWGALNYANDLGQNLAPNGLLFTENTVDLFLLWYLQGAEEAFPDELSIYTPLLKENWYRERLEAEGVRLPEEGSLAQLAHSTTSFRPTYYTPSERWLIPPEELSPAGLVFRLGTEMDRESHSSLLKRFDYRGSGRERTRRHYALVHSHIGEYFYERGELREALRAYQRAGQIDPQNPRICQNLGILYQAQDDVDKALESYERGAFLGSRDPSLWLNLGALYLKRGEVLEAVSRLDKSLSLQETAKARYSLGICYLTLGEPGKGAAETERAIALDPDFPNAYNNLGICYYQLGDYARAALQFKRALELDSAYSEARYNLKLLEERLRSQR